MTFLPPQETLYTLPSGLDHPFRRVGIVLIVLGIALIVAAVVARFEVTVLVVVGLLLPLVGIFLALLYRESSGRLRF